MTTAAAPSLKRSLGLWTVVALGINGVVGQGIFLLPGLAAARMGPAALIALTLGAVLSLLIALCFAEVGARFRGTGGAYLYVRDAFGSFAGFEVGWMTCCVAVISWAALANGFTEVCSIFVPAVGEGAVQKATAVGLITVLTAVNLQGAALGAAVVRLCTVAKLVPIFCFVTLGLFYVEPANFQPFAPHGVQAPLAETTLLLLYAYVGFETLVVPAGEMDDPERSVPKALAIVMGGVAVVYLSIFVVAVGTLPELAGHPNPVAAASERFMGPLGGTIIAAGIVLSVLGTNAGAALVSPRRFYALAERRDLPEFFARISPRTGAPVHAIQLTWLLSCLLCLSGSFAELAVLGVVARFAQYIPTVLAVIVLRRRDGPVPGGFRLPLGPVIPLATVALCLWLLANTDPVKLGMGAVALVLGAVLYGLKRLAMEPR